MSPHAVLGPVDPQTQGLPAASIIRVAEAKPIAEVDDNTLILADIGRKAIAQISLAVSELLQEHLEKERADQIADKLSRGEWTHDYPISPVQAQALGLKVSTEIPAEALELMGLYPQPVRTQPTVEYLSRPRSARERPTSRPMS
jgi:ClpP class serine protease